MSFYRELDYHDHQRPFHRSHSSITDFTMPKMKASCDLCQFCCLIPLIVIVLSVLSFMHLMKATSNLDDRPKVNIAFQSSSNSLRTKTVDEQQSQQRLLTKPTMIIVPSATEAAAVSSLSEPSSSPLNQTVEMVISTPTGLHTVILYVHPEWAPLGANRFLSLVDSHFYDEARFFRVIKNFMAQTGISAVPTSNNNQRPSTIMDDKVKISNKRGTISFAHAGPNTRCTQIFFNVRDNGYLDQQLFAPFAEVVMSSESVGMMAAIDSLYNGYGEGGKGDGSDHKGPNQGRIQREGNDYLNRVFPKLSYIVTARRRKG